VNFSQFWVATHILKVNFAEIARDRPRQPECLPLNVDFSSPSTDSLRSRRPVQSCRYQRGVPPEKWLFFHYWSYR